jgi:protein-S-isoprenylcysteine O-methyltransferase Ste14
MSRIAIFFLRVIAPILALLLALLGVETIHTNPLGWFLLLVGVTYAAGLVVVFLIRKERFWDSTVSGSMTQEERGDRSYWLITAGMLAGFYIPPLEYLYFSNVLPRTNWMAISGLGLVILGVVLFIWARRSLQANYSGHVSVKSGQTLVQSGPYRVIRHPAYAGYLLMALGISLGYSSLTGLASVLLFLLPGMVYRMNVEEKYLTEHFGEAYCQYASKVKRLIPGLW